MEEEWFSNSIATSQGVVLLLSYTWRSKMLKYSLPVAGLVNLKSPSR